MSTYYYFISKDTQTKVFAGSTSQDGQLRLSEESCDWLIRYSYHYIQLVSEHYPELHEFSEVGQ